MSALKPLVVSPQGFPQQLQSPDTLDIPMGDGASLDLQVAANPVIKGTPVHSENAGTVAPARANSSYCQMVIGLSREAGNVGETVEVQTEGVLELTEAEWDAITGLTGGLVAGGVLYLSPTSMGQMQLTKPTGEGEFVLEMGVMLSPTKFLVRPRQPIQI